MARRKPINLIALTVDNVEHGLWVEGIAGTERGFLYLIIGIEGSNIAVAYSDDCDDFLIKPMAEFAISRKHNHF